MWIDQEDQQDPYGRAQNNTNANIGAGGGTTTSSPSSSNTSQGNPSTVSPSTPTPPTQQFATIQDYLGANKTQAEDLGQKVSGSLANTYGQETGAIDTSAKNAQNAIKAGTVNFDQGLVNEAVNTPTSVANNPDKLSAFQKQWNASYSGPSSFETSDQYNTASAAANEANTRAQELGTTGGQQQLLQDQFNVYGQGNKGLDTALLQSSSAFPTLQNQQKQFQSIQDYLTNAAGNVDTAATNAATNTAATQANTQNAFTNNVSNFQNKINSEVTAAQTPAATAAKQLQTDFASGDPNKVIADLKQINPNVDAQTIQQYLTALNTQSGKPTDLSQFYSFNPNTAITTANAVTPEDYANAAAYQALTGVDYTGILNPANASQAGTAPNALTGINSTNLVDYLKSKYQQGALGGTPLTPATPATPGIPGLPATPATGNSFKSSLGVGPATIQFPANATPDTINTLTSVFNTPFSSAGTYHEGALYDAAAKVTALQGLLKNGQLDKDTFNSYIQPIINLVNTYGSGATGSALNAYTKGKQYFHKTTGL